MKTFIVLRKELSTVIYEVRANSLKEVADNEGEWEEIDTIEREEIETISIITK